MGKKPCLFLSHSGADTEDARKLKALLLDAPEAKEAGLEVWFDKDDLQAGQDWQAQLAKAIEEKATAFAVYVGSKGVVNWVEREVGLGISQAVARAMPFIPILSPLSEEGSKALPAFARQYQGVKDPLNDGEELQKLLAAALGKSANKKTKVIGDPFVGLRAMTEDDSLRFFGRVKETKEVLDLLRSKRLVVIVADSGSGKSSLARAGVVSAFRGGALEVINQLPPEERIWHSLVVRPENNPMAGLGSAVTLAGKQLGLESGRIDELRKLISPHHPDEFVHALLCDLRVDTTEILLVLDQFEELFTQAQEQKRQEFVKLLLALLGPEAPSNVRVLVTIRSDYFNLMQTHPDFGPLLGEAETSPIYRLRRISDEGLAEAIHEPLTLAGNTDASERDALVLELQKDLMDRPGDLALAQFALWATWRNRYNGGKDLTSVYTTLGGIAGTLAHEADQVRKAKLSTEEQNHLMSIFARLIRLGDTGGVTRRIANLDEFSGEVRQTALKLTEEKYNRLLLANTKVIEVAHEALITQWSWLNSKINAPGTPEDLRTLEKLMDKSTAWSSSQEEEKNTFLTTGAELDAFVRLAKKRSDWLSDEEQKFVGQSLSARLEAEAEKREAEAEKEKSAKIRRWLLVGISILAAVLSVVLAIGTYFYIQSRESEEAALKNQRSAFGALALVESNQGRHHEAVTLALAGWPKAQDSNQEHSAAAIKAMQQSLSSARLLTTFKGHEYRVWSAVFSPDGSKILTASSDKTARLWDAKSGREITAFSGHEYRVNSAVFSPDGSTILTASQDKTARLWDAKSGKEITVFIGHEHWVGSAVFSPDGSTILTASPDYTARLWDAKSGREITAFSGHEDSVWSAVFSPDGSKILTTSGDRTAKLWDAKSGREITAFSGHEGAVYSAVFSPDGSTILTASQDTTARLWDAKSGREITAFSGHEDEVNSAVFSPDGSTILTASPDKTTRLWDAKSGRKVAVFIGHEGPIYNAVFFHDGSTILTAAGDGTARLWDAKSGREISAFSGHEDSVWSAVFSPDGSTILTVSGNNTVRLWDAQVFEHSTQADLACKLRDSSPRKELWDHSAELINRYGLENLPSICGHPEDYLAPSEDGLGRAAKIGENE